MPKVPPPGLPAVRRRLREEANARDAEFLQRFFKTGPGEYGEGDRFLGIRVPATRRLAREFRGLALSEMERLLHDEYHEARLLALLLLVNAYQRATTPAARTKIFHLYLRNTTYVNNWDLVDSSARGIVGAHLASRPRRRLDSLARSKLLWERRIAIIATQHFIRNGELDDTLRIAELLLGDSHDLIHKAVGWMLREVGDTAPATLDKFLDRHAATMPRTMLRYAVEKMPAAKRRRYMRRDAVGTTLRPA